MGAGRGSSRRVMASTAAARLGWKASTGTAHGTPAVRAEILDAMDRVIAASGDAARGCSTRAIAKVGYGLETRSVAQHLRAMEKAGVVVGQREEGRKHTWWVIKLKAPALHEDFDFGYLPVPASQHPNGGGWVADSANAHPEAYVGPGATVSGSAKVGAGTVIAEGAHVSGYARVLGTATVRGTAEVGEKAKVSGFAVVGNQAVVDGGAEVAGEARVLSRAHVTGDSVVSGEANVTGHAVIDGNAEVTDDAVVGGEALVNGGARVAGSAKITDNAIVTGKAVVDGDAVVMDYAKIKSGALLHSGVYSGDDVVRSGQERGGKVVRLDDSDLQPLSF